MDAQEKAAGVLDTPSTASQTDHTAILGNREADRKEYGTLQAQFALLGITLNRSHRAHDGRISYAVIRYSQTRYFTHLHDLQAHYNALMDAKRAQLQNSRRPTVNEDAPDADFLD